MSPIVGLTDRGVSQFPKIGDIRKGAPKPEGGNRPGADLTYFRAVFPDDEVDAAATFREVYGTEPREINILLPFGEVDRNFEAWNEEHTAGALQHRCDGVTTSLWRDDNGKMQHTPKPCPGGCRQTGRLKVIIPELKRLAYVEVHTTAKWDILELTANLNAILQMNGTLTGVPLWLKRRPRMVSTPRKGGKSVRSEKWLLSIEAEPRWVEAKFIAMQAEALPAGATLAALPAPEAELVVEGEYSESDETGEVTDGEWDAETFEDAQIEPEPEPTPEPEPAAPHVAQLSRPYPPATIKAGIAARVRKASAELQQEAAHQQQMGLLGSKLFECFVGQDDAVEKGSSVADWLIGRDDKTTQAEALALIAWLIPQASITDGTFDLHPAAPAEAAAILDEAQREGEGGQAELF